MNRLHSSYSLRSLVLLLVGLLVALALVFAVRDLRDSRRLYAQAERLAEYNALADHSVRAVGHFAFERGRSNIMLRGRQADDGTHARFIAEKRQLADREADALQTGLPDALRSHGEAVDARLRVLRALRPEVDRDMKRPLAQRDPSLPERWITAATALLDSLATTLGAISDLSGSDDAAYSRLSRLRQQTIELRILVGFESSLRGVEIAAGHPVDRRTADALLIVRGRILHLWQQIGADAERLGDPSVSGAVAQAAQTLIEGQRIRQAALTRSGADGELGGYLQASATALNSVNALALTVNRSVDDYVGRRLAYARREALFSLAGIVSLAVLAGLAGLVMTRRFTVPLNDVLARIDRLMRRHSGSRLPVEAAGGEDEFGRVRQALVLLDEAIEARLKSEAALNESERINATILQAIPQSVIATDPHGLIRVFSPGAERMSGYAADEMVGRATPLILHDPDELRARMPGDAAGTVGLDVFDARMERVLDFSEHEWTQIRKDGSRITVALSIVPLHNAAGELSGYLGVATDITERKAFEEKLRAAAREEVKQNNLLNTLVETIPVGVLMVEVPSGRVLVANDAARQLLGRDVPPDVTAERFSEVFGALKLPERTPYPVDTLPLALGLKGRESHVEDLLVVGGDGSERALEMIGVPVRDSEGNVWACVVNVIDITSRLKATAEMKRLAYYDHLTRLPNRRLFRDRIHMAVTHARRDRLPLAVLAIDLDRFKPVNDNLGHSVGDLLLKSVAGRMQLCLRDSDTLARIGGDEFVAVLPATMQADDAMVVAEKIRLALNAPFDLPGGYRVSIGCCIGIALYPEHGHDVNQLLRNADEAMYRAKEAGRNCVSLYASPVAPGPESGVPVRLVWQRAYCCGEASIDREHHELFDRANDFIDRIVEGRLDAQGVAAEIDDLIEPVASHFANEEDILQQYRYAGLEDHRVKHERLMQRGRELCEHAARGVVDLSDLVFFLVHEVVSEHMLIEDKKYYPLLQAAAESRVR